MPPAFTVVAIVAAYNEEDIIEQVISDLAEQAIQVYFLDDGSTDRTVERVERFVGHNVLAIERSRDAGRFEWDRILRRKAALAETIDADWFIHHDADEFRESPWSDLSLNAAIQRVDALGYNAIDFESLDFWPTHDGFRPGDDVRRAFPYFSRGAAYDRVQIRCWKKTAGLDLASSGGHDVQFPERNVFPLRFIQRHYPVRSQEHGERKIFIERSGRYVEAERARGWHVQYDDMKDGSSFIRDPSTLKLYDAESVRVQLLLRHRGVEGADAAAAAARQESASARHALDAAIAELTVKSSQIERLDAAAGTQRAEIDRLQAVIQAQHADLLALQQRVDTSSRELADKLADVERWKATVADLTARLEAFERSLSWRCTAPARTALRIIRGGDS